MKTILITTFAIASMVFAFGANPAMAVGEQHPACHDGTSTLTHGLPPCEGGIFSEVNDPDQADQERDVADSGNEGSTSAASADDQ